MKWFRIMYMLLVIFVLLAYAKPENVVSQGRADSLRQLILSEENPVCKAEIYLELAGSLIDSTPGISLRYYDSALKAAEISDNLPLQLEAMFRSGNIYSNLAKPDSALSFYLKSIRLGKLAKDSVLLAEIYLRSSRLLARQNLPDSAVMFCRECLNHAIGVEQQKIRMSALNTLGNIFLDHFMYDSAAYYYLETLRLAEKINFPAAISASLINLGKTHMSIGEIEKARTYFLESIKSNSKTDQPYYIALAYTNLGSIEHSDSNYIASLDYYKKAIELQQLIGNQVGLYNLYHNMAHVYRDKGEIRKSLIYYDKALEGFHETRDAEGIMNTMMNKATALYHDGKFFASQVLYDSCLNMAVKMKNTALQKDLCHNIYDNYMESGNYRKALEYLIRFYDLKDSIKMQEHQTRVAELDMKYENEKKQARILALSNENLEKDLDIRKRTNQRNIYMLSGSGLLFASIFILIFLRNKARHERIISQSRIRQLENDRKLIAARFIVEGQEEERKRIAKDLHDGLGVLLATARMQFTTIKESKPENLRLIQKANNLLEQAAMDVRRITHNMMPGLLTKYGFFEAIEDLIEKIDDTGSVSAQLNIIGETRRFPEKSEIMLYRIIQEMAHNTIKHAHASKIDLDIHTQNDRLFIHYRDNGQGFDPEEMLKKKSIGLTSIQSRISFLGGKLKISSTPSSGTDYQLEVMIK